MNLRAALSLLTGGFVLLSVTNSPAPPFPKGGRGPKVGGGRPGGGGFNPAGQAQPQLPAAQIQQLTSAFNQSDRNRDGRMTQPEFGNLMQSSALQQFTKNIPNPGGNQQQKVSQLFQQITGGQNSFNVNQLLGFAGQLMQMKGNPQAVMPRQPQRQPSLFQRLKPPPIKLPFGSGSAATAATTNTASTNASSSGSSTNVALQMNLNEAMNQGYVNARFGSNTRAGTTMQLRLFATEKSSNKKLTLHLNPGARIIPKNRIYTPVKVVGFDGAHPNSFTISRSGASHWPIRVSRERGDGRVPLGYVEFRIVE